MFEEAEKLLYSPLHLRPGYIGQPQQLHWSGFWVWALYEAVSRIRDREVRGEEGKGFVGRGNVLTCIAM